MYCFVSLVVSIFHVREKFYFPFDRIFTIPELQVLQASDNKLKDLPVTVADGCGLQVIDLHGNQLTSLPQQLIMRAPQ